MTSEAYAGNVAIPLEWREPTDHPTDMHDSAIAVADGIGGKYHISGPELIDRETGAQGYLLWFAADEFVWKAFETVDAAKSHAETDWQVQFALHTQLEGKAKTDINDDMVVRAMEQIPGVDHDDMVRALQAALGLPIEPTAPTQGSKS